MGIEPWGKAIRKKHAPHDAVLLFYLFQPTVLISHKLYKEYVQRLDVDGELISLFPPGMEKLIGKDSLLILPGGKGQQQHQRIRAKCLRALAPKQVLGQLGMIQEAVSRELEELVRATADGGSGKLAVAAEKLAITVAATMILGAEFMEEIKQLEECFQVIVTGLFSPPINLGRFSAHGRAHLARERLGRLLAEMLRKPAIQRTALGELLLAGEAGDALSTEEILDSVLTLLLAGQLTTKDSICQCVTDLAERPDLVEQIRTEASVGFGSIEEDSATLRFLTESLRRHPPVMALRRACPSRDIDLGRAGRVPRGCGMALCVNDDIEPSSLQPENAVYRDRQESFELLQSGFGGKTPHACVGKSVALLELQVFLRELCSKYRFEIVEATFQSNLGRAGWRNDLPVRLSSRPAP